MRARLGMILLFAVALPLLHGAAWGETPVTEKLAPSAHRPKASACDPAILKVANFQDSQITRKMIHRMDDSLPIRL